MENYGKLETRFQLENLDLGRCGSEVRWYDSGYITDVYMEIADSNTSIYYYDIERYLLDNIEAVNDWISENGYPGDLYKATQGAEFYSIYNDLLEHSEDILLYWACTYMLDTYGDKSQHFEELDIGYICGELSFEIDRLESLKDQADKLAMNLLESWNKEEQE